MLIALLVNPGAGRGRAGRAGPVVAERLRARGHEVLEIVEPELFPARTRTVAALQRGVEALVAVGGDGVVNLAVNELRSHAPHVPLGIVATGTGNDAARGLGLPRADPVAATDLILRALPQPGSRRRLDLGRITALDQGPGHRWFLNVASAGVDAAVNARANTLAWPRGAARYVVALVRELVDFRGYDIQVIADGEDLGDCGTLVAVANGGLIGGGMLVAPEASWQDGLLDVVTARALPRRTLVGVFPRIYRGNHVDHPAVSVRRAACVELHPGPGSGGGSGPGSAPGSGRAPAPGSASGPGRAPAPTVHADGEPVGALPLRIEVERAALQVLV